MRTFFPDGTPVSDWFYNYEVPDIDRLGTQYKITDYGVVDDGSVQTEQIQSVIDIAEKNGGGVIVVPRGRFVTGALFFKQGVNLYIEEGGTLLGSDDISDYPICDTRIEGQSCKYFSALINADGIDGFTMCGKGTIDGNGLRSWKAFWIRRKWNPECTNKDEQRPRLVYISNCKDVLVADLTLQNSHYWTNHIYRSNHVKIMGCKIFSPVTPVPAPSTDGIDIDYCSDILIKNCVIDVNDDGVALKGGKGPMAHEDETNGINERVIIEDCTYMFCHGCLTCGSESIHNKNIIFRRNNVVKSGNVLWLKLRPDTHQIYEHILIEDVNSSSDNLINVFTWTQFFDLEGKEGIGASVVSNISVKNCHCICDEYIQVARNDERYLLSNFRMKNLQIKTSKPDFDRTAISNFVEESVIIEKQ